MLNKTESTGLELLRDNALPLTAVIVSTIALALGWQLFARRMIDRTVRAENSATDVARIWGGPLQQPQPRVAWRRTDAATVEPTPGELAQSTVSVVLDARYRRRGITEYPGYEADFTGNYIFNNPSPHAAFVAFSIGLPVDTSALMVTDLKLLIGEAEDRTRTEYGPGGMTWTGEVPGGQEVKFTVKYRARGLERFGYALGSSSNTTPVTKFELNMLVRGVPGELDYPVGAMSPSSITEGSGGRMLSWKVERLLSSFDVGVVLPDRSGVTRAIQKLIFNAPAFYVMYALGLLYALRSVGRRARTLHLFALSGGYFLYFPLATYLTAYTAWPLACSAALLAISALAIVHAMRFVNASASIGVACCQAFFLATPAAAYLLPAHTGLILVTAGFIALALGMQAIGRAAKKLADQDREHTPDAVGEVS